MRPHGSGSIPVRAEATFHSTFQIFINRGVYRYLPRCSNSHGVHSPVPCALTRCDFSRYLSSRLQAMEHVRMRSRARRSSREPPSVGLGGGPHGGSGASAPPVIERAAKRGPPRRQHSAVVEHRPSSRELLSACSTPCSRARPACSSACWAIRSLATTAAPSGATSTPSCAPRRAAPSSLVTAGAPEALLMSCRSTSGCPGVRRMYRASAPRGRVAASTRLSALAHVGACAVDPRRVFLSLYLSSLGSEWFFIRGNVRRAGRVFY